MAEVSMRNIDKVYEKDGVKAVSGFNLEVRDRDFVVFVGPSGCGKSTTLRMIAGLEEITAGELYIDGKLMNDVAPKDRDIAMVFQNYALYPHMNVYDNMAFGLKLRKFKKDEIERRVNNAADILGLEAYLDRKPKALSGGQRQRVALGRAIVRDAKVFLMDEPLSNLDAKLRVAMRAEIQKLHQRLETTSIYVTHDQTEAMTMATNLVVLDQGVIQQVGAPKDIYDKPDNVFVGGFIGSPAMNFFNGSLKEDGFYINPDELSQTKSKPVKIDVPEGKMKVLREQDYIGKDIILGIRPEDIHDEPVFVDANPGSTIEATIDVAELMGSESYLYSKLADHDFVARVDSRTDVSGGENITLSFDMHKSHFFDKETEDRIK